MIGQSAGNRYGVLAIALLCLTGFVILLWSIRLGLGLSPDSVTYLLISDNIRTGNGIGLSTSDGAFTVQPHWPPLYPMVIAATSFLTSGLREGAWILHAVLWLANLILVARLAYEIADRSLVASAICLLVCISSVEMLAAHAFLSSEPLFLTFALSSILLLFHSVQKSSFKLACISGVLVSAAFVTRYAGVGIIAGLVPAAVFFGVGKISRRILLITAYSLTAIAPMVVWLIWSHSQTGTVANREFIWHPPSTDALSEAWLTIARWVWPSVNKKDSTISFFAYLQIGIGILSVIWLMRLRIQSIRILVGMLSVTGVVYLFFLGLSICFFDAYTPLDRRTLLPFQVILILLVTGAVGTMIRSFKQKPVLMWGVCAASAGLVIARSAHAASWTYDAGHNGLGYAAISFQQSEIARASRNLPKDARILTNSTVELYVMTGRMVRPLPRRWDPTRGKETANYLIHVRRLTRQQDIYSCYVVLFNSKVSTNFVGELELKKYFKLDPVGTPLNNGAIYRLQPLLTPTTQSQPSTKPVRE